MKEKQSEIGSSFIGVNIRTCDITLKLKGFQNWLGYERVMLHYGLNISGNKT
jgi:hypothetical protein